MQLPQRVFIGALVVPLLLASVGVAMRPGTASSVSVAAPGQLVIAVRSAEIVLAGAASAAERQELVDAVRPLSPSHRVTDLITPAGRLPCSPAVATSLLGAVLGQGVSDFTAVVHKGHLTASARVADYSRAGALSDALRAAAPDLRVDEDYTTTG